MLCQPAALFICASAEFVVFLRERKEAADHLRVYRVRLHSGRIDFPRFGNLLDGVYLGETWRLGYVFLGG